MSAIPSSGFDLSEASTLPSAWERLLCLPLSRPAQAEQEFIELLDAALQAPPNRNVLFTILEQVRASLCFVREASVRHYLEEAPLLSDDREKLFQRGIEATRRMLCGYACCANLEKPGDPANLSGNPARAREMATLLQRCLYYSGMLIFEHHRAKRELPPGIWSRHHALFATASRLGIATLPIDDGIFDESRTTHCLAAYVTPLLVEQACPYGRSPRELNLIWRWAEKISPKIKILSMTEYSPAAGFGVDLEQDAPLRAISQVRDSPGALVLETGPSTALLRQVMDQLSQGVPPERLGLCEEGVERTRTLLEQLIFLWSLENPQRRRHSRVARQGSSRFCAGFHNMHHSILETDPNPACLGQLKYLEKTPGCGYLEEVWEILDRGPSGYRLACQMTAFKLAPQQLLALRTDDATGYRLGKVAWMKREQQGRLVAGVALLSGIPRAVSVRPPAQITGQRSAFCRAFWLGQEPGRGEQSSLLLPVSMQGSTGRIDVAYDQCRQLLLGKEIQLGADFVQFAIGRD